MSGFGAGLVFVSFYSLRCYEYAKRKKIPLAPRASGMEILKSAKKSAWGLGVPVIILGGIYSGVFTPTESAAVAVGYTLFITLFVYRSLGLKDIWQVSMETALMSARILIMVAAATLFSWLLTVQGVTQSLVAPIIALSLPPWAVLLLSNGGHASCGHVHRRLLQHSDLLPPSFSRARRSGRERATFRNRGLGQRRYGQYHPALRPQYLHRRRRFQQTVLRSRKGHPPLADPGPDQPGSHHLRSGNQSVASLPALSRDLLSGLQPWGNKNDEASKRTALFWRQTKIKTFRFQKWHSPVWKRNPSEQAKPIQGKEKIQSSG